MGLIDDCKLFYGTKNLYELLKIKKEANDTVIKQAYKKLSLTVHPDRVSNDNKDTATKKFQVSSIFFFCVLCSIPIFRTVLMRPKKLKQTVTVCSYT